MASLLDISLLSHFSNVFVILFIFTALYAVLMFKKPFGDNKGINALLSASVAIIFIFSEDAIEVVKSTLPWYMIMVFVLIMVLIATVAFGASMPHVLTANIGTWVLIIALFILALNVSLRLGQQAGPFLNNQSISERVAGTGDVATGSYQQNLGATLFHPKVLALMLVIMVAVFSVLWIGYVG